MGNIQNICEQLTLTRRPAIGDILTVDATGNDAEFVPAGAVVVPPIYPFSAPTTPNANNDEFTGTLAGWTTQLAVGAPNATTVNNQNNSRLAVAIAAAANDQLRIAKTLSGAWVGDISVTTQMTFTPYANFGTQEFGFLTAGLNAGPIVTLDNGGALTLRNYSNWGTAVNVVLFTVAGLFPVGSAVPPSIYVHLQRIAGTWEVWVSPDAAGWRRVGTDATAFVVVGAGMRLAGFGATAPYTMSSDFIRFNWLFLP